MKKENEIYIELHISKLIEVSAELEYTTDKLGNMIFKDKAKLKEDINELILNTSKEIDVSEEEIRDYLIKLYQDKSQNKDFEKEGTDLILILQELGKDIEEDKDNKEDVKDKKNKIIDGE